MNAKDLLERLIAESVREPVFEKYPPLMSTADAIEIALERIEEWDYTSDPHGWCHSRPVLLSLVSAAIRWMETAPDPHTAPKPKQVLYRCWCDGSACDGVTVRPFTVCAECARWGHRALQHGNLVPEDIEVTE